MVKIPEGFLFNALSAGIKKKEDLDFGLIYAPEGAFCAGVFTQNLVRAAPVILGLERVKKGQAKGILVNSGCANACTGAQGIRDAERILKAVAQETQCLPEEILPASTGVIGERLPVEEMLKHVSSLVQGLSPRKIDLVARAMMTTDTFPKLVSRTVEVGGREVTIAGLAKGAGMIAPHMATMLAFILTDASFHKQPWASMLQDVVSQTFNRITVDGDTSTNDTVYALASAKVNLPPDKWLLFEEGFFEVCQELAYLIVKDGEGATKTVRILVRGAETEEEALLLARVVADSLLVKTAFFGEDPNWGRILAALGRSGLSIDPQRVDLWFNKVQVVKNGLSLGKETEKEAHLVMKNREFTLTIDLKKGKAEAAILTCDLSYEYVKINAEYRT